MLISMLLRQYFMSLKIIGRWKNWGHHMGQLWGSIHEGLHEVHPVREPVKPGQEIGPNGVGSYHTGTVPGDTGTVPGLVGKAHRHGHREEPDDAGANAHLQHSDSEDDDTDLPAVPIQPTDGERELIIMRKVMRKWWRLTGLSGHPTMCDTVGEEFGVHWTKGICPRVEGRIKIVDAAVTTDQKQK